ncbi:hypothetical protein [Brevundimonas sp.]|uniref:hypothetical protein n=1 Tax=Brevundimonas sp. TaxID=1871086 RepID=UPI0017B2540E|nr:hypothetical protein [Brevundimonas sp.]MBA4805984.1 hypothetical protein [Brevundimonas sp.]
MKNRMMIMSAVAALTVAGANSSSAQTSTLMTKDDGEWITVTGNISNVTPQGFRIDYGTGVLPVEMDGFLPTSTEGLRNGDWVTVSGRIDDALWERRSIEASSVYSSRMQERLWANAMDEEGDMLITPIDLPDQGDWVGVTGRVISIDIMEDEMVVDVGPQTLQVDASGLGQPMTATRGDLVSVYGRLDDADLWDGREIDASSVVILRQSSI